MGITPLLMLIAIAIYQVSSTGIYVSSISSSSVTLGIDCLTDNGDSRIVLTKGEFKLYGNDIHFLDGSLTTYLPNAGTKTIDTLHFSIPYSQGVPLLSSFLRSEGRVVYRLEGVASFGTPLGEADLPLNATSAGLNGSLDYSGLKVETRTIVSNDARLAALNNATFQVFVNNLSLVGGKIVNPLPGTSLPPRTSTVSSYLELTYPQVLLVLRSLAASGGVVTATAKLDMWFQTYLTTEFGPIGPVEPQIGFTILRPGYSSFFWILGIVVLMLVGLGILLNRYSYV